MSQRAVEDQQTDTMKRKRATLGEKALGSLIDARTLIASEAPLTRCG
jgi:hypothetical protein